LSALQEPPFSWQQYTLPGLGITLLGRGNTQSRGRNAPP